MVPPTGTVITGTGASIYPGAPVSRGKGVMSTHGAILLGEVARHLASIQIACNFCPRHGKASVGRLMQEHGPDMPVPELLRLFSNDCPRRLAARISEPCGVHLPELADVFVKKPGG